MSDKWEIHIPARNRERLQKGCQAVVRVSAEAYNVLIDIYNESTLSMKEIATILILEAADKVVYDKGEKEQCQK